MIASIKGYIEIMKELLQAGVKIDQQAKVIKRFVYSMTSCT